MWIASARLKPVVVATSSQARLYHSINYILKPFLTIVTRLTKSFWQTLYQSRGWHLVCCVSLACLGISSPRYRSVICLGFIKNMIQYVHWAVKTSIILSLSIGAILELMISAPCVIAQYWHMPMGANWYSFIQSKLSDHNYRTVEFNANKIYVWFDYHSIHITCPDMWALSSPYAIPSIDVWAVVWLAYVRWWNDRTSEL